MNNDIIYKNCFRHIAFFGFHVVFRDIVQINFEFIIINFYIFSLKIANYSLLFINEIFFL